MCTFVNVFIKAKQHYNILYSGFNTKSQMLANMELFKKDFNSELCSINKLVRYSSLSFTQRK